MIAVIIISYFFLFSHKKPFLFMGRFSQYSLRNSFFNSQRSSQFCLIRWEKSFRPSFECFFPLGEGTFFYQFSTAMPLLLNPLRNDLSFLNGGGSIRSAVENRLKKSLFPPDILRFHGLQSPISQRRWTHWPCRWEMKKQSFKSRSDYPFQTILFQTLIFDFFHFPVRRKIAAASPLAAGART